MSSINDLNYMRKKFKILFWIFSAPIILSLQSCILIDKPKPKEVTTTILNYGKGSAKILSEHNDKNVPSGKRFTTDYKLGITHVSDTIQINKGVQFGVEYMINSPKTRLIEISTVWKYPNLIKNDEGIEFTRIEYKIDKLTNEYTYSSYEITEEFEMKEGEWEIELFYESKSILKKKFILVK